MIVRGLTVFFFVFFTGADIKEQLNKKEKGLADQPELTEVILWKIQTLTKTSM